ncbi:MAG TPA: TMEM175 family protein [Candidatus Babeliales bacterium]|nr:TMEM175 family protein [Candidatus Babeliales bacterium]
MTHERLHALTDGIFAIVMTLLVLELKVPVLDKPTNNSLWQALAENKAIFASYLISFLLLFLYWRAHNFIVSTMAKNVDINLVNINILFLILIGIVPFTTHLLGMYPQTQTAIIIYALNIILIGLALMIMRGYVEKSDTIESDRRSPEQILNARIRVLTPMVCAGLAIPLSFISTWLAFGLMMLGIGFNLLNNAAELFRKVFRIP